MKFVSGTAAENYDVVVVGSGAGALTAGATAARAGKSVIILEKSDLLGGTSAVSGGMLWVADNHHAREAGIADSKAAAAEYVRAVARGPGRRAKRDAALYNCDPIRGFVGK
jgi:succinate dehydrogenase/fumarate reductase flavoprotein subunit